MGWGAAGGSSPLAAVGYPACTHQLPSLQPSPPRKLHLSCRPNVQIACGTPVWEGMHVDTSSDRVNETVKGVLALFKANHPRDCMNW